MSTFPLVTTPTPNQWMNLITRQILGAPNATITISGISAAFRTMWLDMHIVKDGTAGGITLALNLGAGGCDYIPDKTTSGAIVNTPAGVSQPSLPLTVTGFSIAANRDGSWSVFIAQGVPNDATVIATGGFFQNTSAVAVVADLFAVWAMGGVAISTITIASLAGNMAANTAIVLSGEAH